MSNRIWPVIGAFGLMLGALLPSSAVAQQGGEQEARTYVGNIAGLENIGARFVAVVAPDHHHAVVLLWSRDDNFNQSYAKWYLGVINGSAFTATASDGTVLAGTVRDNTFTGTIAGGQLTAYATQSGTARVYLNRVSDNEVDVAIVAPDDSWVGMAINPTTERIIRTWNSGTGVVERVRNAIRVRPAPEAPPVQMEHFSGTAGMSFWRCTWCNQAAYPPIGC